MSQFKNIFSLIVIVLFVHGLSQTVPVMAATPDAEEQRWIVRSAFQSAYRLLRTEEYQKTIHTFQQFTKDNPEYILADYAYFYLAAGFMQTAEYENARKTLESLKRLFPESLHDSDARFLEADTFFYEKQYDTAIRRYTALKKQKRYKNHRHMPEMLIKLGQCYEHKKQLNLALETYHQAWYDHIYALAYTSAKEHEEKLLKQHPSLAKQLSTKRVFASIDTLLKSGKALDAVPWLHRLSKRKLSAAFNEKFVLKRAYTYYLLRENQRALDYYKQYLQQFPKSKLVPFAFDRIGRLYLRQGNVDAFLKIHDQLAAKYPKSQYTSSAVRLKGTEFELLGRYKDALTVFNHFLKTYPKNSLKSDILWHTGWCHYQLQQYQSALKTFDRLIRSYPKSYHREEARYWAARSAEHLKQPAKAKEYYHKIVNTRSNSYFGNLSQQALTKLSQGEPDLQDQVQQENKAPSSVQTLPTFTTPGGRLHQKKAKELQLIGLYSQAAKEFAYAIEKDRASQTKYLELARLYYLANKYADLAWLMRKHFWEWVAKGDEALPQIFWEYIYPSGFSSIVSFHASANGVDPLFVHALILAESVFDPHAHSAAGAMGLMQLMPATGAKLAEQVGVTIPALDWYFRPEINILLGTTYLKDLLQMFQQQLPPTIASYNAGEHRVMTWWKKEYKNDHPAFIASIPYKETKKYVQKVLWYYQEYQRIYNKR